MARRRSTVDFLSGVSETLARAKCAFVGGLKDESRIYNASFVERVDDGLSIRKVSGEETKDWRCVVYLRVDMRRRCLRYFVMIVIA